MLGIIGVEGNLGICHYRNIGKRVSIYLPLGVFTIWIKTYSNRKIEPKSIFIWVRCDLVLDFEKKKSIVYGLVMILFEKIK